ncbi:MAG: HNH endonuclease [Lachnospiraceae bacterium]|nr:HNH endonuclease [Lachnospiraceae bacterium]
MLLEYFKRYIKVSRGVTDKSVKHYVTGINTINSLLKKYDYPIKNVFEVNSIEELDDILLFLTSNEEFERKDSVGHNMYSVAFKHFYSFAKEETNFFGNNIETMDMVVEIPKQSTSTTTKWNRNQILITQAIEGAHYLCEHNRNHETFISKATGKAYMEGHHLIPLKYQKSFSHSIDVYANIVCLCPICHRLLHYGTDKEKSYAAEELFDTRQERLENSGIDLSKKEFLELVI